MTDLLALYEDLHAHPELSFAEHRTAEIGAVALEAAGLTVTRGIGGTGVVGVLANGPGPVVWLRADIDGLPVEEKTGLPYASTRRAMTSDGVEVSVMHACGHDMHITWLIGAIEELASDLSSWAGTLVAILQPAEETLSGAQAMADDGLLFAAPHPDVVLGQHVGPLPAGIISLTSGATMAGADNISITLHGRGGHGSRPETTIDPIVAAASLVTKLQTVVSRSVPPGTLAVVSVGKLNAGAKHNIIPDTASLGLTIRYVDGAVRAAILAAIERIAAGEATAAGMTEPPTISIEESTLPTLNDAAASATVRAAFAHEFGASAIIDLGTVSGSEDVAVLARSADAPLVFWVTGGTDPEQFAAAEAAGEIDTRIPSNHSPFFAPVQHPTVEIGVRALVSAARAWVGGGR